MIIDDIQFISGKTKTQEEFFHIFNVLYQNNKQIILSSDKHPGSIPTLTDRLRSRFEGGWLQIFGMPDFETRLAILKQKQRKRVEHFFWSTWIYCLKYSKKCKRVGGCVK